MVKRPTVVSTFAGCGGSSLGYRWAGFTELLAVDFDRDAVKVFADELPGRPVSSRPTSPGHGRARSWR